MSPSAVFKLYDNSDLLEFNIKQYLDHRFLLNGMYSNVYLSQDWYSGDRMDTLTRVNSTTYQSSFDNWVFEGDVTGPSGYDITAVSGVYVSGVFEPTGSGTYVPHIDYKNGTVVFENAVPSGSVVNADFSYKRVNVTSPDSEAARIIFSRFRYGQDASAINLPSGNSSQLPLIAVNPIDRDSTPWQMGGGQIVNQDVSFHIVANNRRDMNKIIDVLTTSSYHNKIQGVDFNLAPEQFDFYGDKASTYVDFTTLQASGAIQWNKLYIDEAKLAEPSRENLGIYTARVDWGMKFYLQ